MRKLTFEVLAVVAFLAGAGLFLSAKTSTTPIAAKSFVATFQDVDIDSKGNRIVSQIRVQTLKEANKYSLKVYDLQRGKETHFISTSEGIYQVHSDCLQFFGPALNPELPSPVALKATQGFVREEKVLGINSYVFRVDQGDQWVETYVAPETGNNVLKRVSYEGNGEYSISEPLSVQFRSVSDEEVNLPDLPKKVDKAQQRVEEYKKGGATEVGESLRRAIEKQKN